MNGWTDGWMLPCVFFVSCGGHNIVFPVDKESSWPRSTKGSCSKSKILDSLWAKRLKRELSACSLMLLNNHWRDISKLWQICIVVNSHAHKLIHPAGGSGMQLWLCIDLGLNYALQCHFTLYSSKCAGPNVLHALMLQPHL